MQEQEEILKFCCDINQNNKITSLNNPEADKHQDPSGYESLRKFLLRHLTFKFTCPLTVLYGAMMAGKI